MCAYGCGCGGHLDTSPALQHTQVCKKSTTQSSRSRILDGRGEQEETRDRTRRENVPFTSFDRFLLMISRSRWRWSRDKEVVERGIHGP